MKCRTVAASSTSTGIGTCPPRGPTRVVACSDSQAMICPAARSCAASYALAMSGSSAAAIDQVFGPFTMTSTKRTACSSWRSCPRGSPVAGSRPATQLSYVSPVSGASSVTRPVYL